MMSHNPSWAAALQQLTVNGAHFSAEEVVDACLLLTLSERVHVLSFDPDGEAPHRLGRYLTDLGFSVRPVYDDAHPAVAAPDTVVVFVESNPTEGGWPLRSVSGGGAVLIAITTPDAGRVAEVADAGVTLPSLAATTPGALRRMVFDLLATLVVEAIGRELSGRVRRHPSNMVGHSPSRIASGRHPLPPAHG
jgi:hypothetical protein